MPRFSEQTTLTQFGIVAAIIGAVGLPILTAALWIADKYIDEKYATDMSLQLLETKTDARIQRLEKNVNQSTSMMRQTSNSVDGLTLVVLDMQITTIEDRTQELKNAKERRGPQWDSREERDLRDHLRMLHDLRGQRQILFDRLRAAPFIQTP